MPNPFTDAERRRRKDLVEGLLREGFSPINVKGPKGSALHQALLQTGTNLHQWVYGETRRKDAGLPHFLPDWSVYRAPLPPGWISGDALPLSVDPAPHVAASHMPASTPFLDAMSDTQLHEIARAAVEASLESANDNEPVDPKVERREAHDRDFFKAQAANLRRELSSVEHMLEEVGGIRSMHVAPAAWLSEAEPPRGRSVVSMLFTDLHMGEVISSDELLGLNAYNPEIAGQRVRRFFNAACSIGPRWGADTEVQGLLLMLGGDLISGDIHEELRITNELTAHEQVRETVSLLIAGIEQALATYPRVHVVSVPGNHARTTFKPTAKLYSRLSYDTLIAQMVADHFVNYDEVTFQIGTAPDAIVPVLGRTLLLTHGDKMGTGGGQGFAGPLLPIVRGTKKVEAQQSRAGRRPDIICHGHYHHSANPGNVFSNGAFPGYSEYGNGLRAALEPAQQWLFLVHDRWGVRERCEIKLQDPGLPVGLSSLMPPSMAYAQAA